MTKLGPGPSQASDNIALSDTSKNRERRTAALVPVTAAEHSLDELADVVQRAHDYAGNAKSPRTIRAYASDWRDFLNWTSGRGIGALPATDETVALDLADLTTRGLSK